MLNELLPALLDKVSGDVGDNGWLVFYVSLLGTKSRGKTANLLARPLYKSNKNDIGPSADYMGIKYLDLFSGIGGFHSGILQAGVKIDKCYFSEIDKNATKIYKQHFPDAVELGDIRTINPKELGEIDLVTFGFPCQDLSIAGKRAGLGGTRSGLFFEAMRIIKELRPNIFIFENVKGLLTSNEGKDFEIVLREIADIGLYECEWQLVNTSWVLPQNRERVYFIGHFGKGGGQKVFPVGEGSKQVNGILRENERTGQRISGDIPRTRKENVIPVCRGGAGERLGNGSGGGNA